MKVMILAAGLGKRMLPLTANTPKPLLQVGGISLIEHQIRKLTAAGFNDIVINHSWLGEQIEQALGDGSALDANIQWSREEEPLETAGGIIKALELLGEEAFLVVNADVWTDFPFSSLKQSLQTDMLAHLVLVPNPEQHAGGDFNLHEDGVLKKRKSVLSQAYTFSGIAIYHPALFTSVTEKKYPLRPLLEKAIVNELVSAELYTGIWQDIGTPERLRELDLSMQKQER